MRALRCSELQRYSVRDISFAGPVPDDLQVQEDGLVEWAESEGSWDSSGEWIPPDLLAAGHAEELRWLVKEGVWAVVDRQRCIDTTGKPPITCRWVEKIKRDPGGRKFCRSRLVVRELKATSKGPEKLTEADVFASMPPVESLKMLLSVASSLGYDSKGEPLVLSVVDISRAHFMGKSIREVFIELPIEAGAGPDKCGLLQRCMYGTRDAAQRWLETWTAQIATVDCHVGVANPSLFRSESGDTRGMCHGDDFVVIASRANQQTFLGCLSEKFECRVIGTIGFGEDPGLAKQVSVLNRIITVVEGGPDGDYMALEPDPSHAEKLIRQFGLAEGGKPVKTPRIRKNAEQAEADGRSAILEPARATQFRSGTMRLAYVSQDRPDIAEAVKHLTTRMSAPRESDLQELKRLVRYIKYRPRAELRFAREAVGEEVFLNVFVDSGWGSDHPAEHHRLGCNAGEPLHQARIPASDASRSFLGGSRILCSVQRSCHRFGVGQLFF